MMRFARCAAALIVVGAAGRQTNGTVFTESDIQTSHLIRRPAVVEGREWLGLQVFKGGSRLEQVDVHWVGSLNFEDSLFTLSVQPGAPAFIVADVPQLSAGPAVTLSRYEETLSSRVPLHFVVGSRAYSVELTGTSPTMCDAAVTLSDGTLSQGLYFPDQEFLSCDEPHFSVQWVGDLDGDGRLDLLTTFSQKYSYYPRRLWLSSAAQGGELVGLVATLDGFAA